MEVTFYLPQSDVLKKYIEGYYFFNEKDSKKSIKYWTFPNNFCILSVNLNSSSNLYENKICTFPSTQSLISSSLVYRYQTPIEITINPPINEITIYFKPLGLNNFVTNLNSFFNKKKSYQFSPFINFEEEMLKIFNEVNREKQIKQLEKFWLSKLISYENEMMTNILLDVNNGESVERIAKKYNYSRQNILKLFYTHLGKSISEYKKIDRFKKAIYKKENLKSLTEITYENEYYDQSHMIKDFKRLTSLKPSHFFKAVDTNKPTIWQFIN